MTYVNDDCGETRYNHQKMFEDMIFVPAHVNGDVYKRQLFNSWIRPSAITIVSDHLSNQISGQICAVVNTVLAEEGITYDTICTVQYDSEGKFAALQTDMARLVLLQNTITTDVAQEFDNSLI